MKQLSITRFLDARHMLDKRSSFLFGPRQTGKTTLMLVSPVVV
ncbi:MAG: hypothetical protein OXQ89_15030 [Rhodospirillaceae bacterium]|nr:hypothetical protein [Rhodospirillaceae bacterium]